jgi:hypothetical protein
MVYACYCCTLCETYYEKWHLQQLTDAIDYIPDAGMLGTHSLIK